jgi:hypothetical protein
MEQDKQLEISRDEKEKKWRVKVITASQNEVITWKLKGTDAYFQFPQTHLEPLGGNENWTYYRKDGDELKLKVKSDAKAGEEIYAVFCAADNEFAEGNTPPRIIIK